jgi:hypothetical protein
MDVWWSRAQTRSLLESCELSSTSWRLVTPDVIPRLLNQHRGARIRRSAIGQDHLTSSTSTQVQLHWQVRHSAHPKAYSVPNLATSTSRVGTLPLLPCAGPCASSKRSGPLQLQHQQAICGQARGVPSNEHQRTRLKALRSNHNRSTPSKQS